MIARQWRLRDWYRFQVSRPQRTVMEAPFEVKRGLSLGACVEGNVQIDSMAAIVSEHVSVAAAEEERTAEFLLTSSVGCVGSWALRALQQKAGHIIKYKAPRNLQDIWITDSLFRSSGTPNFFFRFSNLFRFLVSFVE